MKHTVLNLLDTCHKEKLIFQESVKTLFKSKIVIVISWANYKQKQLISIYNNKNDLITACILPCIVYVLFDCNWVSGKKNNIKCSAFLS